MRATLNKLFFLEENGNELKLSATFNHTPSPSTPSKVINLNQGLLNVATRKYSHYFKSSTDTVSSIFSYDEDRIDSENTTSSNSR